MKKHGIIFFLLAVVLPLAFSCTRYYPENLPEGNGKVFILYCDGYNNLPPYMKENIRDLCLQAPDSSMRKEYRLLVLSHFTRMPLDYRTPNSPVLEDIFRDQYGNVVRDTVAVFPDSSNTASAAFIEKFLTYVHAKYPAKEYGMVFSSHGTGWLPERYYDEYSGEDIFQYSTGQERHYFDWLLKDAEVKSMGCQGYYAGSTLTTHEIEMKDFAAALPFHFKYLILDACLMGGVETAYQLREKTDYLVFSQAEVSASGFQYETMLANVLYSAEPDLVKVCKDYVKKNSSATVSLIDCRRLDPLAECCAELFEKYREAIAAIDYSKVQSYFRFNKHWFYDLQDMMKNVEGVEEEDLDRLADALDECVLYKEATEIFMSSFKIWAHSGLSTYIPANGEGILDDHYRNLDWNIATALVPFEN